MVSTDRGPRRGWRHSCGNGVTRSRRAAERHVKASAAPPSIDANTRRGEGERGFLPRRLKSGFDHHRSGVCGPSHGRISLA